MSYQWLCICSSYCLWKSYISSLCINGSCKWMSSFTIIIWSEDVNCLPLYWPCPWSRVFMRAGLVILLLVSYPAMNIIIYRYLTVQVTLIALTLPTLRLPLHHAWTTSHQEILKYSTHFASFKISLQTFISLYCSISYRTYCGCTYSPEENKILYVWKLSYWISL